MIYTQPPGRPRRFSPLMVEDPGQHARASARRVYLALRRAGWGAASARYHIVDMLACGSYIITEPTPNIWEEV